MILSEENELDRLKKLMQLNEVVSEEKALTRLNVPEKHKVNVALQKIMKQTYFNDIPLDEIFGLLAAYGLVPLQEDNTKWEGMLIGADSHTIITLGYARSAQKGANDITFYTPIENAGLSLSWYKMREGRYEVIAYVS